MNNRFLQLTIPSATLLVTLLVSAPAECRNFYAQADIARTTIDERVDAGGTVFELDDSTSAYRIALGYDWTTHVSVEAAYNDFGDVGARPALASIRAKADGYELGLVFHWPVTGRFSFSGRLGYLLWEADTQVASLRSSDSGEDWFAGIGAEYQVGDRLAITLDWKKFQLDDLDFDQGLLGLRWSFGGQD